MRVAAGVILIIAAVINLFASFGYLAGGALVGGAGKLTTMAEEQSRKQGRELTEEQKASFAQLNDASGKMKNVTFTGCGNTLANQSKQESKDITLVPEARLVPTGIGRIAAGDLSGIRGG